MHYVLIDFSLQDVVLLLTYMLIAVIISYVWFCVKNNLRNEMLLHFQRIFTVALVALFHGQDGNVVFSEKLFSVDDETETSKFIKIDQKLSFFDKRDISIYYFATENTGDMIDYTDIVDSNDESSRGDYVYKNDDSQSTSEMTDFTTNSYESKSEDYGGKNDDNESTSKRSLVTSSADVSRVSSPSTSDVLSGTFVITPSPVFIIVTVSIVCVSLFVVFVVFTGKLKKDRQRKSLMQLSSFNNILL